MSVTSFLREQHETAFSFEILPPVRGRSIGSVYRTVERLLEFNPAYINITTHRTEVVYHEESAGVYRRAEERMRPGTVAIAAALKARYGIVPVPHVICSGFSQAEIENELIDLDFLEIKDLILLRGDRARGDNRFVPTPGGHGRADELCRQVEAFNRGELTRGARREPLAVPFTYGVAGYPEKHDEAMNAEMDLLAARAKVEAGAGYLVTQMFYDNAKYFDYVGRLRRIGITVPVVPGLKPLTTLNHCSMLPRTFHIDFPEELARELARCTTDADVKALGVEWAVKQARELKAAGVPSIHFYSMNAAESVERIAKQVY